MVVCCIRIVMPYIWLMWFNHHRFQRQVRYNVRFHFQIVHRRADNGIAITPINLRQYHRHCVQRFTSSSRYILISMMIYYRYSHNRYIRFVSVRHSAAIRHNVRHRLTPADHRSISRSTIVIRPPTISIITAITISIYQSGVIA